MNYLRKLTWEQVCELRSRYVRGDKQTYLAAIFNITQSSVSRILNGKSWKRRPAL